MDMEPKMASEDFSESEQKERKLRNLFSSVFWIAFFTSLALLFTGSIGVIVAFFSKKHRNYRKPGLIMVGIGVTGILGLGTQISFGDN